MDDIFIEIEEEIQEVPLSGVANETNMDFNEEGFIGTPIQQSDGFTATEEGKSKNTTRTKKTTSNVWNYFEKLPGDDEPKAKCNSCKLLLSARSSNGTSHLKKHVEKTCSMRHLHLGTKEGDKSKLRVKTELDGSRTLELKEKYKPFDQEHSRTLLTNMVVIHEYPLFVVDQIAFREFVHSLNPHFKIISRNKLKNDILKMYADDKLSLQQLLSNNDSRIAIRTDMWTASNKKKGYMAVTSHFIDRNWVLRNRTLRFCFVPCPHTGRVLSKVLMDCLSQYGLESKISSVVVDNASTNDSMMNILLQNFEKKNLRNKMDCIEHYFKKIYGENCDREIERVIKMLDDLVVEYQQRSEMDKNQEETLQGKKVNPTSYDDDDDYARVKKTKKMKVIVKSEVDYYLDDSPEEEDDKFDILSWWKVNTRYPTLKRIAKDILAIPISSVASESAFSMGGRVVSAHRSRLTSNTIEALMYLQNWKSQNLQDNFKDNGVCSTVNEDNEQEDYFIDIIHMDVDDMLIEDT